MPGRREPPEWFDRDARLFSISLDHQRNRTRVRRDTKALQNLGDPEKGGCPGANPPIVLVPERRSGRFHRLVRGGVPNAQHFRADKIRDRGRRRLDVEAVVEAEQLERIIVRVHSRIEERVHRRVTVTRECNELHQRNQGLISRHRGQALVDRRDGRIPRRPWHSIEEIWMTCRQLLGNYAKILAPGSHTRSGSGLSRGGRRNKDCESRRYGFHQLILYRLYAGLYVTDRLRS